ncbi:MAG: SBBP repeat-containing protein [Ignavibacteriaceae bacterium]|nr:SBBP repeat-containing protein [Ignavibacteriaceae bacterium]
MKTFIRSLLLIQIFLFLQSYNLKAQSFTWIDTIISSGRYVQGTGISVDGAGNSYVTGEFYGSAKFDTITIYGHAYNDIFIAKFGSNGVCLWATDIGQSPHQSYGNSISTDSEGNSYFTGLGYGTIGNFHISGWFVSKFNTNGNCLWAKSAAIGFGFGGVSIDSKGNCYITGGGIIEKFNSNGDSLWVKQYLNSSGRSIAADANQNIYITGNFIGNAIFDTIPLTSYGGTDIFISKYDSNGNCLWAKQAGDTNNDAGYGISIDANGNSYVTGYFNGTATFDTFHITSYGGADIFISKYDSNGNCLWVRHAGGNVDYDYGTGVCVDANGNSYIIGHFTGPANFDNTQLSGYGGWDAYIAEFDHDGNNIWAKQIGGSLEDQGNGISVDILGNIYATGFFTLISVGRSYQSTFVTKINNNPLPVELSSFTYKLMGNSVNLKWITQTEINNNRFEIERKSSNSSWNKIGEVKGSGTSTLPKQYSYVDNSISYGKYIYRLKQIDYNGQYKYSNELEVNFLIPDKYSLEQNYPNPFNPSATINYSLAKDGNVKLIVYNTLGSKVATIVNEYKQAGNYSVQFNGSIMTSGIYFYKLEAGQFIQVKKMILIK